MRSHLLLLMTGLSIVLLTAGCHKKAPVAASPATPTAPSPALAGVAPRPSTTVVRPTAPPRTTQAMTSPSAKPLEDALNQLLDAYFDYNEAKLRNDALSTLNKDSDTLRALLRRFPDTKFIIAGNCDERGSAEYNLALGDRRAQAAREFLTNVGVPAERLTTISYGKERPICSEHNEECWQKNRRAHLTEKQ